MNAAVIFKNVNYDIGGTAILRNLNFEIERGKITGLLGLNGAGKSTLLSLINGLRSQTSGRIFLLGKILPAKDNTIRSRIGVVFQETALYEELTVYENLEFIASLYNVRDPAGRIGEVLGFLRLEDRAGQIVKTLSGGLKRRVGIARAFLHNPELFIIDEPTLGVDVETRHSIWSQLRLLKSKGRTVIVATNYLDEAQALCDNVIVLDRGRLLITASPEYLTGRAGYCLDIECGESVSSELVSKLAGKKGVLRTDTTQSGISIFLKDTSLKKELVKLIAETENIGGFKFRSPDLAEVFKSLQQK